MTYENPRKTRLLKEALGDERAPLPTVGQTCVTIALMVGAVIVLVLAGRDLPAHTTSVPAIGQRHAELTLPVAPDSAGAHAAPATSMASTATDEATPTGNVVDLTY